MPWERAVGLCLAAVLLVIWSVYCRRLTLDERRRLTEEREQAEPLPSARGVGA